MIAQASPSTLENIFYAPSGIVAIIVLLALIYNSILWLFLPWIMMSKMNTMIKHLKNIESATEAAERHSTPAGAARSESSVKYKMPGPND